MENNVIDISKPILVSSKEAAQASGMSEWYVKQGIKAHTIPHVRCGRRVLVNLPLFLESLNKQSNDSLLKL